MLGREGDGGTAEGVVEPGVLGVGRGEEALEVERGGDTRDEGAGPVEEGEEAIPIDGEEEGVVGGEESSASGKGDGAAAEGGDGEGDDGAGVGEFGDVEEVAGSGRCEGVEEVCVEERLEATFNRHPDGLRLKEGLKAVAGGWVGEVVLKRSDGGEEGLINARTGAEAGVRCDFRPRVLCSERENLRVAWVLVSGVPGERGRDADEGMQNDEDRFEDAAKGLKQREAVSGISKLLRLHERDDSRQGTENGEQGVANRE